MRHFGPNHATDFFTTTEFVSRRVVLPAGARASRAEPGPGEGPPPFVRPQGNAEVLRRLGGGQAPERAGMDVIRRFARLRLSGCHPDSASNVSCRGRPGRSSPTRPLSSRPALGPTLVKYHGQRPWLCEAPQRGARHLPEGPAGADAGKRCFPADGRIGDAPPAGTGFHRALPDSLTGRFSQQPRRLAWPVPRDVAKARFTRCLHAHKNLAGSAEPSRVARPKAVGLARTKKSAVFD